MTPMCTDSRQPPSVKIGGHRWFIFPPFRARSWLSWTDSASVNSVSSVVPAQSSPPPAPIPASTNLLGKTIRQNMSSDLQTQFDALAQRSPKDGSACWSARDLCPVLGYARWETFVTIIKRAVAACVADHNDSARHFQEIQLPLAEGEKRPQRDFRLTRYACHLIALNGDARREAVAAARVFFEKKKERVAAAKPAPKAKAKPAKASVKKAPAAPAKTVKAAKAVAAKPAKPAAQTPAKSAAKAVKVVTKPKVVSGSRFIPQAGDAFYGSTHASRNSRWNPNCAVSRGYPNRAARTCGS